VICSVTFAVRLSEPLVPVIASGNVPRVDPAVIVSVDEPPPAIVDGLKPAEAPLGSPETDNATLPLNPFAGVTVTVNVVLRLRRTDRLDGLAESENVPTGACGVALASFEFGLSPTLFAAVTT
jgi:hypothetical protein